MLKTIWARTFAPNTFKAHTAAFKQLQHSYREYSRFHSLRAIPHSMHIELKESFYSFIHMLSVHLYHDTSPRAALNSIPLLKTLNNIKPNTMEAKLASLFVKGANICFPKKMYNTSKIPSISQLILFLEELYQQKSYTALMLYAGLLTQIRFANRPAEIFAPRQLETVPLTYRCQQLNSNFLLVGFHGTRRYVVTVIFT